MDYAWIQAYNGHVMMDMLWDLVVSATLARGDEGSLR